MDAAVGQGLLSKQIGDVGIYLGRELVPDETTVCRFRHLLEEHDLGQHVVRRGAATSGSQETEGGYRQDVYATIINAPSSTKNAKKARDPELHQTKKGNQWYFSIRRISVSTTAAS